MTSVLKICLFQRQRNEAGGRARGQRELVFAVVTAGSGRSQGRVAMAGPARSQEFKHVLYIHIYPIRIYILIFYI